MIKKEADKADKRRCPRVPLESKAEIVSGSKSIEVDLANISCGGILFHSQKQFELGDTMTVMISGVYREASFSEHVPGKIVTIYRREGGNSYGLQFSALLHKEQTPVLIAFLAGDEGKGISFLRDPRYAKAERKN
jgi:hypothetical protein